MLLNKPFSLSRVNFYYCNIVSGDTRLPQFTKSILLQSRSLSPSLSLSLPLSLSLYHSNCLLFYYKTDSLGIELGGFARCFSLLLSLIFSLLPARDPAASSGSRCRKPLTAQNWMKLVPLGSAPNQYSHSLKQCIEKLLITHFSYPQIYIMKKIYTYIFY